MQKKNCIKFLTEDIKKIKIAVIGDVMLDRYYFGEVKRISPEAPVPVNRVKKVKSVLGGAANVAANLAGLECEVYVGGITGDDDNRKKLEAMLDENKINYEGLYKSKKRATVTKLRIIGETQQMLRLDFEEIGDLDLEEVAFVSKWLDELLIQGIDGIVLSDYAKGVCSDKFCKFVIERANEYDVPVLVDPKGAKWEKYTGADFITPNLKEMGEAANEAIVNEDDMVHKVADIARIKYGIKNVVVTRSEKGMTLVGPNDFILHSPATAQEVFDVSGAGDTVAATLLLGVAGKMKIEDAVYQANRAAGIVVSKVGTYPIHRQELLKDILSQEVKNHQQREDSDKCYSKAEIVSLVDVWHKAGDKVVFTNGCFDLLHVGHVTYLAKAAALGQHLILGLNSDESVKRLKGETRPLVSEKARAIVLAALRCIDAVVMFDEDTPANLIKAIKPDILVKGGDYKPEDVVGKEDASEVKIIKFEDGYSTTGVVEKIASLVKAGKL